MVSVCNETVCSFDVRYINKDKCNADKHQKMGPRVSWLPKFAHFRNSKEFSFEVGVIVDIMANVST